MINLPWLKDLCPAGRQGLFCFLLSTFVFLLSYFTGNSLGFTAQLWGLKFWGPALYFCLFNFVLKYCYKGFLYEVSTRSTFLGCSFATGLYLSSFEAPGWRVLGSYAVVMSLFHFSEFLAIAATNPRTLSADSFILNHSLAYGLAALASWIEWGLEFYFFPDMKKYWMVSAVGLLLCAGGELLRKGAMFTAKTNFNHLVQYVKHSDHELVSHGVYALCRHPSYVGWFYWSVGTQLILLNPVCTVIYLVASWSFFRERVYAEEETLLAFFGDQYCEYQRHVGTGLPFISGYLPGVNDHHSRHEH